jgi:xanthine dehydrogenase YagS FAD-binding subunit
MLPRFSYVRPTTVDDAIKQLTSPGARVHAGGTDLLGCLRDEVFGTDKLVSIAGIKELRGVAPTAEGGMRIGALTTLAEIAANPEIATHYPALAQGAGAAASPQLRNQGTIGGNLCQRPRCWYFRGQFHCARKGGELCYAAEGENQFHCIFGGDVCFIVHPSDTAPALVAHEALVRIAGPAGTRVVPIERFFVPPSVDFTRETILEPSEILTEIVLRPPLPGSRGGYRKVRARGGWDFALAGVATTLQLRDGHVERARIVLSGAAPVPWRVPAAEEALVGSRLDAASAARAAEAAVRGAEPLAENGYKVDLFRGVIEEHLLALA